MRVVLKGLRRLVRNVRAPCPKTVDVRIFLGGLFRSRPKAAARCQCRKRVKYSLTTNLLRLGLLALPCRALRCRCRCFDVRTRFVVPCFVFVRLGVRREQLAREMRLFAPRVTPAEAAATAAASSAAAAARGCGGWQRGQRWRISGYGCQ